MGVLEYIKRRFSRKIIIAIHGLDNKPPRDLLLKWWKRSIQEGIVRIGGRKQCFAFDLVYWAHFFYEKPRDPAVTDKKHPLYLEYPYVKSKVSLAEYKIPGKVKRRVLDYIERKMDGLFFDEKKGVKLERISDFIIRTLFRDLDLYYHRYCTVPRFANMRASDALRGELERVLMKYRKKRIMLIAHSMGSIISFDVLARSKFDFQVDTFVTIGSPLRLPVIVKKNLELAGVGSRKKMMVPHPGKVSRAWFNFSDLDDRVAINYNLADDYGPGAGGAGPVDVVVKNDYERDGDTNAHQAYGYLRAPEMSRLILDFLAGK